jgi:hypothetical protein
MKNLKHFSSLLFLKFIFYGVHQCLSSPIQVHKQTEFSRRIYYECMTENGKTFVNLPVENMCFTLNADIINWKDFLADGN